MNQKTIEKLVPPPPGSNKPGVVTFDDGSIAKFWPSTQFGAALEVGVTATAVTETKEGRFGDETILKQWGEAVRPAGRGGGGGGGGRQMSPEERRSIAIQCCMKAAAELHHGSQDLPAMCKTIKALMVLHDGLLSGRG